MTCTRLEDATAMGMRFASSHASSSSRPGFLGTGFLNSSSATRVSYPLRRPGRAALGFRKALFIRKPQRRKGWLPEGGPHPLGVEHQAVHIKNHTVYHKIFLSMHLPLCAGHFAVGASRAKP